ncbi:MAG: alpha/beta hydrolase [Brevefilum sp.]|nr:alpha/beta hydrolase [Brevefilum sp.]MDT8380988.1 alpha/beta hydrolase [Brevefilum sp.]MDW7753601.1 alpha/beta hydrolase [Brevefilum sp.]
MKYEKYQSPMEAWPAIKSLGKKVFLKKNQLNLFYYEAGIGNLNHMLMIHGLGDEADTWRHVINPLARDHHVLAVDLPGFGRSDKIDREYSPQFFIDTLHEFLTILDIKKAFLMGSSLGGMLAQGYAVEHPEQIAGLILVGGSLIQEEASIDLSLKLMQIPLLGKWLYTRLRKNPGGAFDSMRNVYHDLDAMPQKDKDFLYKRVNQRVWSDGQRHAYFSTLRAMTKWVKKSQKGLAEKLSLHNFPTLIIRGEFDALFSENYADSLIQAQANAAKVVVQESGHLPHQETPTAFLDAVLVWEKDQI